MRRRAEHLESAACALARVTPEAVGRLAWTDRALAVARAAGFDTADTAGTPAGVPAGAVADDAASAARAAR